MNLRPSAISAEIRHTHLTNYFKTHESCSKGFMDTMDKFPDLNRNIGNIPPFWVKKIPKNQIKEANIALQNIFSDFAQKTYSPQQRNNFAKKCKDLSENLKKIINRDTKVTSYKKGQNGRTFIIFVDGEKYILKTFHSNPMFNYYLPHGKGFEVFSGFFASRNDTKNSCAKFYMGKIARENDKDGYLLTKIVDDESSKKSTGYFVSFFNRFIIYGDCKEGNNKINDTCYDFGLMAVDKLNSHPKVRKIVRSFIRPIIHNDLKSAKLAVERHEQSPYWRQALAVINDRVNSFGIVFENTLSEELKDAIGIRLKTQEDFKKELQDIIGNIEIKKFDVKEFRWNDK